MDETRAGEDSVPGQGDGDDPLRRLASALRDLWTTASEGEASNDQRSAAAPSKSGVDRLGRILGRFADLAEAAVLGRADSNDGRPELLGGMMLLGQAYLVATISGLRYWRRLAQTYGRHQSGLLQALLPDTSGRSLSEAERRLLVDDIRAYLRELGDISAQEARAFQVELDKLAEAMARMASGPDQTPDEQRRWKAKP